MHWKPFNWKMPWSDRSTTEPAVHKLVAFKLGAVMFLGHRNSTSPISISTESGELMFSGHAPELEWAEIDLEKPISL